MPDTYYRFEEVRFASLLDEFENPVGTSSLELQLVRFVAVRKTPKGVRLNTGRWISDTSVKRYAHSTVEGAAASFKARKTRQIQILQARIGQAVEALRLLSLNKYRGSIEPWDGVVKGL